MTTGRLKHLVNEVMGQGVLTSEAMYSIDHLLRRHDYTPEDMNALDRLLQALIEGHIRSQSPSVNLFLARS